MAHTCILDGMAVLAGIPKTGMDEALQPGMTALLIDDHPIVANALCMGIKSMDVFARIVVVASLAQARERLRTLASTHLVVVDLNLDDASGTEAVEALRVLAPDTPLVVFSADDGPEIVSRAYRLGAQGFVSKSADLSEVMRAIRIVLDGQLYISPVTARALGLKAPSRAAPAETASPVQHLSPRQRQVLDQLLQGMTNKMIGDRLNMAEGTVKTHLSTIYRVFGVNSRAKLMLRANSLGLSGEITSRS